MKLGEVKQFECSKVCCGHQLSKEYICLEIIVYGLKGHGLPLIFKDSGFRLLFPTAVSLAKSLHFHIIICSFFF